MKILAWLSYEEIKNYKECNYDRPHRLAVIKELNDKGLIITGAEHQAEKIPLFEDGYLMVSMRTWGEIMASAMVRRDHKEHNYMDFYM